MFVVRRGHVEKIEDWDFDSRRLCPTCDCYYVKRRYEEYRVLTGNEVRKYKKDQKENLKAFLDWSTPTIGPDTPIDTRTTDEKLRDMFNS